MNEKGRATTENQDSPGVLNEPPIGRFITIDQDITDVSLETIQSFQAIPDYRDPTESILPIVVETPASSYCVDGWNLIEAARTQGNESIRCHISRIEDHSNTELAIRKVEIRTKPQGGTCSYPELIRNTCLLERMLMEECDNPIMHSHGGARRGEAFTGNREEDVRGILTERLGKSRSTVNQYLAHGRHLDDQLLEDLATAGTGKFFFEKAQINKRRWIGILEGDGKTPEEIAAKLSDKMREWLAEFQESGKIAPDFGETDPQEETGGAGTETMPPEEGNESGEEQAETFRDGTESESGEAPELPNEHDVRASLRDYIKTVSALLNHDHLDVERAIQIVEEQIGLLAGVRSQLVNIRGRAAGQNEKAS